MPNPRNKKELQHFLDMINYLGKLIPNLSMKPPHYASSLKKDMMKSFDMPQQNGVQWLKMLVTKNLTLKYFDRSLPIRVSLDASIQGLGDIFLVGFRSLVEEESTYRVVVNSLNLQKELMDVHLSDISKILRFSTSNLVSFMFIKSRHFPEAYLVLLHKTSHTSCVLFFFWFPRAGSRESTPSVSSR